MSGSQSEGKYGKIITVRLDEETENIIQKLRENDVNVSKLIRRILKEYFTSQKQTINQQANQQGSIVIIERTVYFNNVCRDLLKAYDDREVFNSYMRLEYSNALSFLYTICKKAFGQSDQNGGQK